MIPYSSKENTDISQPRRNANDDMSHALVRSTSVTFVPSTNLFTHSHFRSMSSISTCNRILNIVTHTDIAPTAPFQNPFFGNNATILPSNASTLQCRSFASQKHKRIIKMAKGYRGRANRTYRAAIRRVEKGLQYSYRDRKVKKRNFRRLWIERVNAGVRQHGMSYSRFIRGMQRVGKKKPGVKEEEDDDAKQEGILLNRKVLADLAANEPFSFKAVVDVVKMKMGKITGSK
eukprot:CAMPEP_0176498586 /NCGR_PEP_ID=MMETSP0200_2-20121128/12406_1 /TAXON_ID=947934 /ORGANISM="Chaetoceros sp., Strain GSL56" /LENGTH=231 /DNA_ID=CAMNT_0017896815 /DNA_START=411 /DNA_END=1106 /DNA_ORIENTATION=-